ncbi:WSC domain-containing protein [Colletotrichum graminicola M1.001]|uniref:WSC domain-containing protein n=1 Tax=Colletotrichum graminicola (strain M1.001 / M2 / FGSC 10212) TaxID=645133 RepID=E3QJ10_COLGM|nr:WSC domain-containing protein [Colletotrichum graminicola M1.001]EFQ30848.1 WSC domain-containing protein [Colletotrichum graminicola M1.001]
MVGVGLVILTFFTALAVSQALPRVRNDNTADNLAMRDTNVQARQLQGAPWGLPWGIFDGVRSASPVNLAQPAIATPLPAAAPALPNNQPQAIPGVLASLTAAIGGAIPSNVLASAPNVVSTLLQPGGPLSLPPAVPSGEAGQTPNSGGLLIPIQSLVSIIVGAAGNAGSPISLSGVTGVLNPLTTLVDGGGIPASQVTAVTNNGVPVGGGLLTATALSAAIGVITAAPGILTTALPISNVVPSSLPVSNLNGVLSSVSVVLPDAMPSVDLGGLNAPQLPTDLAATVPNLIGSLINPITQDDASVSTTGGTPNQATISPVSAAYFPCTMVEFANGTPTFIFTTCSTGASAARPQPAASTALSSASAPVSSATVGSVSSLVLSGVPSTSSALSVGGGTANLPVSSPATPFVTPGSSLAGTPQRSSTPAQPTADINDGSPVSASPSQPGAGSQGNSVQPQNPSSTGQFQSLTTNSNASSNLTPVIQTPAGATGPPSQPNGGVTAPSPQAPAVSIQTTVTVAAGPPASQPSEAPLGSKSSPSSSPTPSGGSVFADDGQGSSPGGSALPGTPVIPISDCPAVVQCPACPASSAEPPSSSDPCPGRGYSCSECLNGWFCPPKETPMLPAPCGMGWPCYHCKGGWYCAPSGSGGAPAGANNPPAVVITTVTAFLAPLPTGPANGGTGGDGGDGNGGSGNSAGNGSGDGSDNGSGGSDAGNTGGSPGNGVPASVSSGNAASTPCTTTSNTQPTSTTGSGGGGGNGNGSGDGPGNGSGNSSGNGSGGRDAGNTGGSPGNGVPTSVGSSNAASTSCTTTSNTQPTSPTSSGSGSGNGNGTPNSPGNGNSVSTPIGNGPSLTTSTTDPNTGSGSPPGNGSPTNGGPPSNDSGNGPNDGQGSSGSGNPPSGYGDPPSASPAAGNPNDDPGSGAPNGSGAPGPATTAAGGNGDAGSGNPNAGPGGGSPSNVTPKAAAEVSGWTHLGCFKDSPVRTLDCDPSKYFAGSMSNEKCISHCAAQGFRLAGTEYGKECWCGNAFQLAERIPEQQCNEVCDGRSTDICGGDWAVTVYSANGQALSVPSDDDTGNGNTSGNGKGSGNTTSPGSPSNPPAGPLASSSPPPPPQTSSQGQPSPAPAENPQPALTPSGSPSAPSQQQIDVVSLINSIINALPKGSLDGGYGSGLGARDSGASDNNGAESPDNAGIPNAGAGGSPMMGPGPVIPTVGLSGYGSQKRDVAGRSVKRSSIIGRRAVAKSDSANIVGDADGCDGDCVVEEV